MSSPLHQFVSVSQGHRKASDGVRTRIYQALQKEDFYRGHERTYRPYNDEGEAQPPEVKRVQKKVLEDLAEFIKSSVETARTVGTVDAGNCIAKADVIVDGKTIAAGVPVSHLLWLEKQFVDLKTVVEKLPTLDPAKKWSLDPNTGLYKTDEEWTVRTQKQKKTHVAVPATDKHPAQVMVYDEDTPVGKWQRVDYSGAIQETRRQELVKRILAIIDGVVQARERANSTPVESVNVAKGLYDYVLGD